MRIGHEFFEVDGHVFMVSPLVVVVGRDKSTTTPYKGLDHEDPVLVLWKMAYTQHAFCRS